ncbi:MAG: hypothetical protein KKA54_19870 [Proteobacteria bacterium]|nr:hypothetical protein [Pseudomonadota bacterium]MBU0968629.1 hypothetical protein [Pseudomonadota bacterium]
MKCDRENCLTDIDVGEERYLYGRVLCEDCYMDALSPAKTCDPWAVRSASIAASCGETMRTGGLQKKILDLLKKIEGLPLAEPAQRLAVRPGDMEREIAALRHMEKVRAAMVNGRKVITLW